MIYVSCDKTGSKELGTFEDPFTTITAALNVVNRRQTIKLRSGSYVEDLDLSNHVDINIVAEGVGEAVFTKILGTITINENMNEGSIGLKNLSISGLSISKSKVGIFIDDCIIRTFLYYSYTYCSLMNSVIRNKLTFSPSDERCAKLEIINTYFGPDTTVEMGGNGTMILTEAKNVRIYHTSGTVVVRNNSTCIGYGRNDTAIFSSASGPNDSLILQSGTTMDYDGVYWPIVKTGICPYAIEKTFRYNPENSLLTGKNMIEEY
jgi:hypothetical protein